MEIMCTSQTVWKYRTHRFFPGNGTYYWFVQFQTDFIVQTVKTIAYFNCRAKPASALRVLGGRGIWRRQSCRGSEKKQTTSLQMLRL